MKSSVASWGSRIGGVGAGVGFGAVADDSDRDEEEGEDVSMSRRVRGSRNPPSWT